MCGEEDEKIRDDFMVGRFIINVRKSKRGRERVQPYRLLSVNALRTSQ